MKWPKELDHEGRPRVKLVGAHAHGHVTDFWLVEEDQPHGSNLTLDLLSRTIDKVFKQCEKNNEPIPMHLWVQVDNTAAENKNQLVVRYLGALIDKSVFRSAVLSFMRVGHTHEDIGGSTLLLSLIHI